MNADSVVTRIVMVRAVTELRLVPLQSWPLRYSFQYSDNDVLLDKWTTGIGNEYVPKHVYVQMFDLKLNKK